ncbi:unnamed protein product, partial [Scytosiphon promiscuus]
TSTFLSSKSKDTKATAGGIRSRRATDMSRARGNAKSGGGGRGGRGNKAGKGGAGAKGEADKNDPAKPKKARSAYNFYLLKRIAQLKEEGVVEHHRDRFAQAASEWRDMTFGERIPYEDMARADKERHQKDLDIATRNLNAALLGSVPKHGQGMCSAIGFPGLKALAAKSPHEDVCAECKEEGDLLCCDFCPATHHLNCLDPPMLSLPSDDVQWACPACSAKVEAAEMSAPQLKPKRERKDGKKRQRASNATGAAESSSPRAGAGTRTSLPTPKPKEGKRSKAAKEESGPKLPKVKREDDEVEPPRAPGGNRSANRMVTAPRKASISPRVGLGLTEAKDEMSAVRHADLSGSHNNDRSPSKAMMSLAVAAASVAASEAAIAAAVAAASAAAAPAAAPPKALGLKKLLHQRVQHDEANSNPAFSPKKLLKHRLLAAQQTAAASTPTSDSAPSPVPPPSDSRMGGGGGDRGGGVGSDMGDAGRAGYGGQGDDRGGKASDGVRHSNGGMGEQTGFGGRYGMDPSRRGDLHGGGGEKGYSERDRVAAGGDSNGRTVGDGRESGGPHDTGAMNGGADPKEYKGRQYYPSRDDRGVDNDGRFQSGGERDRPGLGGEQRREAEFNGGGYDVGRNAGPGASRGHARGASGSGWTGGLEGRRRFAKDADGGGSERWACGGGQTRMDAPQLQGYTPAPHGQERRREEEFFGNNRRGSADGSSWKAGDAAGQRRAQDSGQQQQQQQHGQYPRGRSETASRPDTGARAAAGGGYRKESALGTPSAPRWDSSGRGNWRPDHPREGREDLMGRHGSREAVPAAAAGRGAADEVSRETRPVRPGGREGLANGGPRNYSRSGSACGHRVDGSSSSRARPGWGGCDGPRSGGPSRAAAGATDGGGGGISVSRDGSDRAYDQRYGDRKMAESAGDGRGGMSGSGASHGGWSDRKRPLESSDGQEGLRGSPKKHASSPKTDGTSRTESRSRPGRWNATDRPQSGGASFSGAGRPDSRERSRNSRATSRPASREGRSTDAQDYGSAAAAAANQVRGNFGGSTHRLEDEFSGPARSDGARSDYRETGMSSNNSNSQPPGRAADHRLWNKQNAQHARNEHGNNQHARNGPHGGSNMDSEDRRHGGWAQLHFHGGGGEGRGDGRGNGRGDGRGGGPAGRGHWKARLAGGRGGSFATRDHPDRARGPGSAPGAAGGSDAWHASRDGGDGKEASGPRQGGREDEATWNGVSGGSRASSQGGRGREGGTSIHPTGNRFASQPPGRSGGGGPSGLGVDRRTREPGFRQAQVTPASASGGGGGDDGGRKGKDYSGLALPKPAARSVSSAPPAASGAGYAALAASPSSAGVPATTASVARPDRGRSQEYDRGQQQRSMGRPSSASGGGGGGSTNSFHTRGGYDGGNRGGRGFRQQVGGGDGGGGGGSSSIRDFQGLANGGRSGGSSNGRPARSRSPPSRSARRSSASPSGRQQGYVRQGGGGGFDSYAPSGGGGRGGGGGDDSNQRPGRPRSGFESAARGEEGSGGPERKPWNARSDHHHNHHNIRQQSYGNSNGFGKDGDRFDGRPENMSNSRLLNSANRRGNFPGRGEGGGFGARGG